MKVRNFFVTVVMTMVTLFFSTAVFATLVEVDTIVTRDFGELDSLDGHASLDGFTPGMVDFTGDHTFVGDFTDMTLNSNPGDPLDYLNFQFAGVTGMDSIQAATLFVDMSRMDMNSDWTSDPRILINDSAPGSSLIVGTLVGYLEKDNHNASDVYEFDLMPWVGMITMENVWFSLQPNYPNNNSALFGGQFAIDAMSLAVEGRSWIDDGTGISDGGTTGTAPVPEPATMLLFGTGLVGLVGVARKKSKKTPKA